MDDLFDGLSQEGERFTNAPLIKAAGKLDKARKKYHHKAGSHKSMSVQVSSPDFKKLINSLGKKSKGRPSSDPVEFAIYNDASRPATEKEQSEGFDKIYYAKFWEYGFTSPAGKYIAGHRLFAKTQKRFVKILKEEYLKMPNLFVRENIEEAFDKACYRYINEVLIPQSPTGKTGKMKDSWWWKSKDQE